MNKSKMKIGRCCPVNQVYLNKRSIIYKYIRPAILLVFFLLALGLQYVYLITGKFGLLADAFLYTIPFYLILCVLAFIPKLNMSWTPISIFLFSSYCLFNEYFPTPVYPAFSPHVMSILSLSSCVLLDFVCFIIDTNKTSIIMNSIKKFLLSINLSLVSLSGGFLLYGIYDYDWRSTPFENLLNQVFIPFSTIITVLVFLYYAFLISKPDDMISKEKISIIKGVIFCLAFVFTLIMMIARMIS